MDESLRLAVENKVLVAQLFEEAIHQGNLAVVDEMFSMDFVDHSTPDQVTGPTGVKAYFMAVRVGFPDIHVNIDDLIAEGDRVVVRSTWHGTHTGTYAGTTPTGRRAVRTLIQIFRVVDGKLIEEWNEGEDMLDALMTNRAIYFSKKAGLPGAASPWPEREVPSPPSSGPPPQAGKEEK